MSLFMFILRREGIRRNFSCRERRRVRYTCKLERRR